MNINISLPHNEVLTIKLCDTIWSEHPDIIKELLKLEDEYPINKTHGVYRILLVDNEAVFEFLPIYDSTGSIRHKAFTCIIRSLIYIPSEGYSPSISRAT